ncbi:MAG: DJ-1/PfpI family protein [Bacillales bacterium]|nr:DJ-1/PfpI family protein [Bacillales bacterium]
MNILTICTNGTEDSELVGTVSLLKRGNIDTTLLSVAKDKVITGSHGVKIVCDLSYNDVKNKDLLAYDGLFFPGGGRGSKEIRENEGVLSLVREYAKKEKPIFAICGAPSILGFAGVLKNKRFTCYDGFEQYVKGGIYVKENVVKDQNIITARSVNYVTEFALMIIDYLQGSEIKNKVIKAILRED